MTRLPPLRRRALLQATAGSLAAQALSAAPAAPNIVVILADDLGFGDLGCYGSRIGTPNIDRIAAEGVAFTDFYSANPLCSPSRAALMTGRYAPRTGVADLLFPTDTTGLPDSETTIPQVLKPAGYRSMCVGKWHLGCLPAYMPLRRGFDEFYGLPYSHDMSPLPLLCNNDTVEPQADICMLTQRYTQAAVDFIGRSARSPFFLYMAHSMPHIPLAASAGFAGRSPLGPYGDVVEELDWSVGQVMQALRVNGIDDNTLVVFTSDNGPWFQGSAGALRGRKGQTYEGGVRMPCVARFPGRIPAGSVCKGVASTIDILPTAAGLANVPLPKNPLDGVDIWPLLTGAKPYLDREMFLYFVGWELQCARYGAWKLHLSRLNTDYSAPAPSGGTLNLPLPRPELYDVVNDPEESYNLAARNPGLVSAMRARVESLLPTMPERVRQAWKQTQSLPVLSTPDGAYPILKI